MRSIFRSRSISTLQTVARGVQSPSAAVGAAAIAVLVLTGGMGCFTVCFSVTPAGLVSEQRT
jgi:hypothetical protein